MSLCNRAHRFNATLACDLKELLSPSVRTGRGLAAGEARSGEMAHADRVIGMANGVLKKGEVEL